MKTCHWCEGESGFAGLGPLKTRAHNGGVLWLHDDCYKALLISDARDAFLAQQEARIRGLKSLIEDLTQALERKEPRP